MANLFKPLSCKCNNDTSQTNVNSEEITMRNIETIKELSDWKLPKDNESREN